MLKFLLIRTEAALFRNYISTKNHFTKAKKFNKCKKGKRMGNKLKYKKQNMDKNKKNIIMADLIQVNILL